jgi:hypothetical protein
VAIWWTAEDDGPGRLPWMTEHRDGAWIRIEMPIRATVLGPRRRVTLVIRAYAASDDLTASLEAIRVERTR